MPDTVLSIRNLRCSYSSRRYGLFGKKTIKPVLGGIDLDIRRGEIFGLLGESGCGKTTLGKCVLGLLDYEGVITVDGVRHGNRLVMAKKVQAVFQNPAAALNPARRVGGIIESPLVIHRIGTAAERRRLRDEMLETVGLDSGYARRRPHELSGGQKQRVCIAAALILKPALLVADEAVSSLDVSAAANILNLFRDLRQNMPGGGLSILFITHDANASGYLCDRTAVMKNGRLT